LILKCTKPFAGVGKYRRMRAACDRKALFPSVIDHKRGSLPSTLPVLPDTGLLALHKGYWPFDMKGVISACRKGPPASAFFIRTCSPRTNGVAREICKDTLLCKPSEFIARVAGFGFFSEACGPPNLPKGFLTV